MSANDELRALIEDLDAFPPLEAPSEGDVTELEGMDAAVAASRSLRGVARRRAELAAVAGREIDELKRRIGMVEEWLAVQDRPLAARHDHLAGLLEAFALARRAENPREKTLSTPYVRVATREAAGSWRVGEEALVWAREHRPDLVRVVESVPVSVARREWLVSGGVVFDPALGEVPGVEVEPSRLVATVTVLEDGVDPGLTG